jgi:hypothetical protein
LKSGEGPYSLLKFYRELLLVFISVRLEKLISRGVQLLPAFQGGGWEGVKVLTITTEHP